MSGWEVRELADGTLESRREWADGTTAVIWDLPGKGCRVHVQRGSLDLLRDRSYASISAAKIACEETAASEARS